jgi:hypothetical protein
VLDDMDRLASGQGGGIQAPMKKMAEGGSCSSGRSQRRSTWWSSGSGAGWGGSLGWSQRLCSSDFGGDGSVEKAADLVEPRRQLEPSSPKEGAA